MAETPLRDRLLLQGHHTNNAQAGRGRETSAALARVCRVFVAFAFAISCFGLGGCRYSDALANIIDDPHGAYEPDADPILRQAPDAPEDEERTSSQQTDSENLAVQEDTLPVFDPDAPDNGVAKKRVYNPDSADSLPASEGTVPQPEDQVDPAPAPDPDTSDADVEGAAPTESELQQEGQGEPDSTKPAGRGGTGATYGADGTYEDLPDASCIAATGQYALIVQMLGGQGALAAADAGFVEAALQAGAFPGEGLDSIPIAWSGDGSSQGSLDVDALVSTSADVVLVGPLTDLPEGSRDAIAEAGIDVVQMPSLGAPDATDADVQTAVRVVGQLLASTKSQGALDASAMAAQWSSMHDEAIQACVRANGGYSYKVLGGKSYSGIYQPGMVGNSSDVRVSTAFIDSWAPCSVSFIEADRAFGLKALYLDGQVMDCLDGIGLSATVTKGSYALIDYYLQTAGVVNNAYDSARPVSSSDGARTLPYPVVAGSARGLSDLELASRELPSALWFGMYGTSVDDAWFTIGDRDFPALLARTPQIAQSVSASAAKVNGLYNMGKPYTVRVVPSGLAGSWADGTVESYLIAPWAFGAFQSDDLSQARTYVDEFCETFYRVPADGPIDDFDTSFTAACPTS